MAITSATTTNNPTTANNNIRAAIANGSLQQQLTPLGLSLVPGSLGTSTVRQALWSTPALLSRNPPLPPVAPLGIRCP